MARALREGATVDDVNRAIEETEPLLRFLGYRVVELGDGYARAVFPHGPNVVRRGGMVHGGAFAAVMDQTIGLAVLTVNDGHDQVTVELKVNFLEPGRGGTYTAVGRVLRRGRTIVVGEGEVLDVTGKPLVKAIGTWYILR